MNKLKRFLAAAMIAPLALTAVPFASSAAETDVLPDWVPTTFKAAMNFYNAHGATYIQDGLICTVRTISGRKNYDTKLSGTMETRILCDIPLEFDPGEFDSEFINSADYEYLVTVYKPTSTGTLDITHVSTAANKTYSFVKDKDGAKLTETDIYGWLPDCYGEYQSFKSKHGKLSAVNGYVAVCDTDTDGMTTIQTFVHSGKGALAEEMKLCYFPKSVELWGGFSGMIALYKPTAPGAVKAVWETVYDAENAERTVKSFNIGADLSVSEISDTKYTQLTKGDVNGDGVASTADMVLFQGYLLGRKVDADYQFPDLVPDGKINIYDLVALRQIITSGDTFLMNDSFCPAICDHVKIKDEAFLAHSKAEFDKIITGYEKCVNGCVAAAGTMTDPLQLSNINDDFFKTYDLLVVYNAPDTSSRSFSVDGYSINGSELTVYSTIRYLGMMTDDYIAHRMLIAVDKRISSGVKTVTCDTSRVGDPGTVTGGPELSPVIDATWSSFTSGCNTNVMDCIFPAQSMDELREYIREVELCDGTGFGCSSDSHDVNDLIPDIINDAFFEKNDVVLIYNERGSSSRDIQYTGWSKDGNHVTIYTTNGFPGAVSADMRYYRMIVALPKGTLGDGVYLTREDTYIADYNRGTGKSVTVSNYMGTSHTVNENVKSRMAHALTDYEDFVFDYNDRSQLNHYVKYQGCSIFDVYYKGCLVRNSRIGDTSRDAFAAVNDETGKVTVSIPDAAGIRSAKKPAGMLTVEELRKVIGIENAILQPIILISSDEDEAPRFAYLDKTDDYADVIRDPLTGEVLSTELYPIP